MKRILVLCTVIVTVLSITVPAAAQPANDDLANATPVTGIPFQESVDTTDATTESEEPVDGEFCPPRGTTVWYALTLSDSQAVTVDTAGSDYDTTLAVYTGNDYTDLELVDCNDDTIFGLQAAVTFTADAGVTYLIQAGSFGGDDGGQLNVSIGEPGATKGKPVIFRSKFKGLVADASSEEFDEETGAFSAASATLVDGQSSEGGKPSHFATLFVSEFSEVFDEVNETFTFTEWFGSAELDTGDYEIDKKLRSAWVMTGVVLEGLSCTGPFEGEELECTDLGLANVDVDLSWHGVGGIEKTRFMEKTTFDGVRLSFRGRISTRQADIVGGWSGDLSTDLTGAFGSISHQSTGDFVMIRGVGLP